MARWRWISLGLIGLIGLGVWLFFSNGASPGSDALAASETREPTDPEAPDFDRLQEQSEALMPAVLSGVRLGMREATLQSRYPELRPRPDERDSESKFFQGRLEDGSTAIYGFRRRTERLFQVQVMNVLSKVDLLPAHLDDLIDRYGPPSGLFLCPHTGDVPTLRFLWRSSQVSVAEILLFYENRVSATLYLASNDTIKDSFAQASCRPTTFEELYRRFPMATVDQLRQEMQ